MKTATTHVGALFWEMFIRTYICCRTSKCESKLKRYTSFINNAMLCDQVTSN